MIISIIYRIWTLFSIWLFISKIGSTSRRNDPNDAPNINDLWGNQESMQEDPLAPMSSSEASGSGSGSQKRKHAKSKGNAVRDRFIDYRQYQRYTVELSPEKIKTIVNNEKEIFSRTGPVVKWPELIKYPLDGHKEMWKDHCTRLWPGIEGLGENIGRKTCESKFIIQESHKRLNYKIFSLYPSPGNYIFADLLWCKCKYGRGFSTRAFPGTTKYFFAIKLSAKEYFLVTHKYDPTTMDNLAQDDEQTDSNSVSKKPYHLKIVDFVTLS